MTSIMAKLDHLFGQRIGYTHFVHEIKALVIPVIEIKHVFLGNDLDKSAVPTRACLIQSSNRFLTKKM